MSDSVRPHRQQPTRLPCPWDSPGKNTRVGCHFLLQCMKVQSESEVAQSCLTLSDPMDYSLPGSSVHGIFQARVLEWVPLPSPISFLNCPAILVLELQSIRNEYPIILPRSAQLPPASASLRAPHSFTGPPILTIHTHTPNQNYTSLSAGESSFVE